MSLRTGILAVVAAFMALFTVGCGGGNSTTKSINGIWTGTATQTRAVGDINTIQIEFFQNGTSLMGYIMAIPSNSSSGTPSFGTLTGTVNGNNVSATINNGSGNTANLSGIISGTGLTGTYTNTSSSGTQGGTFTLSQSSGVQTTDVAGTWSGTTTGSSGPPEAGTLTFTQNKDALTVTGTVAGGAAVSGTGVIIGNSIEITAPLVGGTGYLTGTVSGNAMTGTTQNTMGGSGTFSFTKNGS